MRHKNTILGRILIVMAIMMLVLLTVSPADAINWKAKYTRFSAVAGETLATGDVVCISGTDSKAYLADANDSSLRPAVGVIGKGGASGATVEIIVEGIVTGMTAKSPGARVFLSETAGDFTTTEPTNSQVLGWVLPGTSGSSSSTTYYIKVQAPNTPSAGY